MWRGAQKPADEAGHLKEQLPHPDRTCQRHSFTKELIPRRRLAQKQAARKATNRRRHDWRKEEESPHTNRSLCT